jgi:site-specific DNA-cytosine methylase
MMIAHPPCTHLAVSGARWFKDKQKEQEEALEFVRLLLEAPIQRIALENPVSIISSRIRKPDQIIQPWQHGHPETKATCLWLKGLPCLLPTNIVAGRSRTLPGIAQAMAEQWTQQPSAK